MTREFFTEESPFLSHPALTGERTRREIDFVLEQSGLQPGSRVLDVGCGFGRHSIELARRGYAVTGIDPAAAMVAAARQRAAEAGIHVDFHQMTGEGWVGSEACDLAICLFNTLGQVSSAGETHGLATNIAGCLKDGGLFVVETFQRGPTVAALKPSERFGGGERYTEVIRSFDPISNQLTERFQLVAPGQERTYRLCLRLYSVGELETLLTQAGLQVVGRFGAYDLNPTQPLTADSPAMLMVCRK